MLDTSRHKELFNPENFKLPITIIGAGATGSWLTLMLAKLGITDITVWDFDIVEEHNIANQAYRTTNFSSNEETDIKRDKVKALGEIVYETIGDFIIKEIPKKFTNQRLHGIVFLMVDSMAERKRIWENSIKLKPAVQLLIEPRMGLDLGRIYNVNPCDPKHIKEYENTYYTDDETELSACGNSKTVITTATTIAAWCARQLINFHAKEELDNEILIDVKYNNIISGKW